MKLYVCWGTFPTPRPGGHPCANAYHALTDAGHEPEVVKSYGFAPLGAIGNATRGRREVQRLTGKRWVPVLVLDDGTVIDGSKEIVAWAQTNPASQSAPASVTDPASQSHPASRSDPA